MKINDMIYGGRTLVRDLVLSQARKSELLGAF